MRHIRALFKGQRPRERFLVKFPHAAALACSAMLFTSPCVSAASFDLGFNDEDLVFTKQAPSGIGTDDAGMAAGLSNARTAGATVWRLMVRWDGVARIQPPNEASATDPAWTGYDWTRVDREIRAVHAAGLQPIPWVIFAPTWAEGADRPPISEAAPAGTWRPSRTALHDFAIAIAKRYSGRFPDPLQPGVPLPRVNTFQGWNEPNLSTYLTPQWVRAGKRWSPASPGLFRGLLNAFYSGVKSVDPALRVVAGATAPFGDLNDGDPRMPPVRFWRELLCIPNATGVPRPKPSCPKVSFDIYAHHPYPIGPPTRTARNRDDAVVPDLGKISRLVSPALKAGIIVPRAPKPLWVTEVSWDSAPDPDGLPLQTQALYLEGALYEFWKAGASLVTFWNMRDQAPVPNYASTYQSGIFARGAMPADDDRKPSYTAFHFPFTAYRARGVATLWGKAPDSGSVQIQVAEASGWVTVATLSPHPNGIYQGKLRVGTGTKIRAVQTAETSLTWTTR